jgi:hypothetical protein
MTTLRNVRIIMNQSFKHPSHGAQRITRTRQVIVGLVAVGALLLGSSGIGAAQTAAKTVSITAADNGRVITAYPGAHIVVTLANSGWTFSTQGTRKVVSLVSTTVTKGAASGATHACVPGHNCASVKAVYFALEPGLMRLIAVLTSCPTNVTCSGAQSHWTVVIRVR